MNKKIVILLITLTFFVSVFCCGNVAFAQTLPWNISVQICHEKDLFTYDLQQNIPQNADVNGRRFYESSKLKWQLYQYLLTLNLPLDSVFDYILPNFCNIVSHFDYLNKQRVDSQVVFDGTFSYTACQNGVQVDKQRLFESILRCGKGRVSLPLLVDKAVTEQQNKQITTQKGRFYTSFYNSNDNRIANITLATKLLNGVVVEVGQTFSFNQVVGKRTEQNGYKNAKVIENGIYVDGVGGGVCQVSTTLYNALLLSGIIPKAYQHSLVPSYVMAGFDAMVSDNGADLTFTNDTGYPLYIKGEVQDKRVIFTIFGVVNTYKIQRVNEQVVENFHTVFVTDSQKYPHLIYCDQTEVITNGSNGVKSKSYLQYYLGDKLVKTSQIRANNYKKVDKVVAQGDRQRPLPIVP